MTDSPDDLAAFLMHRSVDPELSEQDRLAIFVLVEAYQEGDDPPLVFAALRAAAGHFAGHPDYRPAWAPLPGQENVTIRGALQSLRSAETHLPPPRRVDAGVLNVAY